MDTQWPGAPRRSQQRAQTDGDGIDFSKVSKLAIAACGTAYLSGLIGKYWIEKFARVPVEVDVASEFRYRDPVLSEKQLAIFISQSGETADTLAALKLVPAAGATMIERAREAGEEVGG